MLELNYNFLHWFKRHHFLYMFGFFLNFRPITPFYHEMLVTTKNITDQEYYERLYPVSTYSAVIVSFIIFICINFCLFNYLLVLGCVGGLVFSIAMWQTDTVGSLQVAEVFEGCFVATEIIYFASIYVCHDLKLSFAAKTASIRVVPVVAQLTAAILAQLLVTNGWLNLTEITFLGVPACAHSILLVYHLPSMFELQAIPENFLPKLSFFKKKLKDTFSNHHVVQYSLWIAFTMSGYAQISFTMQTLWRQSQIEDSEAPYNGAIEGICSFLSLLGILLGATLKPNFKRQNALLSVTSLLQCSLLFGFAYVSNTWERTILYIVLNLVYHFVITRITAIVAESANSKACFGTVFSFIGLIYSILNLVFACVINNNEIYLTVQQQFTVYGGYHFVAALLMAYVYVVSFWCKS
ncbi:hypothetical protein Zmor_015251 [Zophobas morio]|uniref:Thiamine transporter 2 n=1 Tax=Zophobas morio TaxID=2755281 RepID=A0AA38MHM3_9CUCU|nr:hypothetical protein Zmor_015251 [Zophobas morio]